MPCFIGSNGLTKFFARPGGLGGGNETDSHLERARPSTRTTLVKINLDFLVNFLV